MRSMISTTAEDLSSPVFNRSLHPSRTPPYTCGTARIADLLLGGGGELGSPRSSRGSLIIFDNLHRLPSHFRTSLIRLRGLPFLLRRLRIYLDRHLRLLRLQSLFLLFLHRLGIHLLLSLGCHLLPKGIELFPKRIELLRLLLNQRRSSGVSLLVLADQTAQ